MVMKITTLKVSASEKGAFADVQVKTKQIFFPKRPLKVSNIKCFIQNQRENLSKYHNHVFIGSQYASYFGDWNSQNV